MLQERAKERKEHLMNIYIVKESYGAIVGVFTSYEAAFACAQEYGDMIMHYIASPDKIELTPEYIMEVERR
jgi:hypothetical protein